MTPLRHIAIGALLLSSAAASAAATPAPGYPISQVPFTAVKVDDSFWTPRLRASRDVTIPLAFSKCESTGRYDNFVRAVHPSDTIRIGGFPFDDTDVYKTIEGASYLLQTFPDKRLEAYIDSVLTLVAAAQEPDGYLYTARTMNPAHPHDWAGSRRWEAVENLSHEFYNLGHMVEGAVAHFQATGKRNFLDIATRYADCVVRSIGTAPGQTDCVPGHQIAEMALARLYLATGDRRYLDQAKYFLDRRGHTSRRDAYSQAHLPVVEQKEAVGHAVRAAYMYSGMADVAALTADSAYIRAIDRIWDNIVGRKLYITGGIGATSHGEAFGADYELPNMSAYCETCAAIGNVYVNHRLFLLHGDSKYYDVVERTLYNGLISGVSLDGGSFFYPNPLESAGQHRRQPWFGCACCPSNVCRFIPSIPGYVYAVRGRDVYVNLFMGNIARLDVDGRKGAVALSQHTDYPRSGHVDITVDANRLGEFALRVRIPGWAQGHPVPSDLYSYADSLHPQWTIAINGQPVEAELRDGYATISRRWRKGDVISLDLPMVPRVVTAHPKVKADRGRVAVERGPLVYCAEWPDNEADIASVLLNRSPRFEAEERPDLPGGVTALYTPAQQLAYRPDGTIEALPTRLTLIPYFAWAHRGAGKMAVWLARDVQAVKPTLPYSLATSARLSASTPGEALTTVSDGAVPADASDRSVGYFPLEPLAEGADAHWLQYDFPEATFVRSASIHWVDDAPWGDVRLPRKWRLRYRDTSGHWHAVGFNAVRLADPDAEVYPTRKGEASTAAFDPVEATAIRLEISPAPGVKAGVAEWSVE